MSNPDRLSSYLIVFGEVVESAKKEGFGKGKPGTGSIPCSICKEGIVSYSIASINGHIWASCSTPGCVRFMQ